MIEIYTDGACSQNGTWAGGWASVMVIDGEQVAIFGGGEKNTTNNRMEMMAFLCAVEGTKHRSKDEYVIHTDSAYIVNAFKQGWIDSWIKNGWKNAKKQPVANQDLWQQILEIRPKEELNINKVKGHAGNKFNEVADDHAVMWRKKIENSDNT